MDLKNIKPGDEITFINKSEGPGVVIYIQGNVVGVGDADVTLEVTDSGTLIGPGYMVPYDPTYPKGSLFKGSLGDEFDFLSLEEFAKLREEYEVVPQGTIVDDPEPPSEEEEEEEKDPLSPDEESDKLERSIPREDVEEGTPAEEEDEEGLQLVGEIETPLKVWGRTHGIVWPKGFPQDWMEQIYKELPEGSAEESGGLPVVKSPGGKGPGIVPRSKEAIELEKKFDAASKKAEEAAKNIDKAKELLNSAEESEVPSREKEYQQALKDFDIAKREYIDVKKRIGDTGDEPGAWVRPPDETTYEQIPGRHITRDTATGKAGLRQAIKHLSNQYKQTRDLVESVNVTEQRVDQYQKELDLLLRLRKKKMVEESDSETDPHYVLQKGEHGAHPKTLDLLRKLKEKELKSKPYLFSMEPSKDTSGVLSEPELDRVVATSAASKLFEKRVGGPISFFDLPPEEVDQLINKEVEKSGPMDPKLVAARAEEYAEAYKEYLKKNAGWKKIAEELQKYLRSKKALAISEEQAERLDREIHTKGTRSVVVRGRDIREGPTKGQIIETTLPVQEIFKEVVQPIKKNFENRAQYFQFLQHNRRNLLAQQKARLRRMLTKEEEKKSILIDDSQFKDALISLFAFYDQRTHGGEGSGKVPGRYKIHHGPLALKEKSTELAEIQRDEKLMLSQLGSLEGNLKEPYVAFERIEGDLDLFKDDIVYVQSKDETVAKSGILGNIEGLEQSISQIKKMMGQREFLRKFPSKGTMNQVGELSNNIRSIVNSLMEHKLPSNSTAPKKYSIKFLEILTHLKRTLGAYENIAKSVEAKMAQINLKLEALRDKKDKLAEEIK